MAGGAGDEAGHHVAVVERAADQQEADFASVDLASFQQRPSAGKQLVGISGLGRFHYHCHREEGVV